MKARFTTFDILAIIPEIRARLIGLRVLNVYDIDNKTYLIRLAKPDVKDALLFESGQRIQCTDFDWPKNAMPSGFSMKLRKHLRGRRLVKVEQLGVDRIVDLQFGEEEAAYHLIVELYDRGNVILTDHQYTILNLLRVRTDESQDVKFAVREPYPIENAKQAEPVLSMERLHEILVAAKDGDQLKRVLNPHLVCGPSVIEHCLLKQGFVDGCKIGLNMDISSDLPRILTALQDIEDVLKMIVESPSKGFIIKKKEKKASKLSGDIPEELITYAEYHPMLFEQHKNSLYIELESFGKAVDEFVSQLGTQKLDIKALQQEKSAIKKLENVKKDHEKRIQQLQTSQNVDMIKAQLIEINLPLVDRAIQVVQSAIANQIDWAEIWEIVKEAQTQGDEVAKSIKSLKLDKNHITLLLKDPFVSSDVDGEDKRSGIGPLKIEIDLDLSAYANARKYYEAKKHSSVKEQKTLAASQKALKSAEIKTKQTLKDVATVTSINKARKTYWFEKYIWFISSENYLIIGGRDQQQNEIVVRKYLNKGDIYVHADLHGASSVIIKNPTGADIPPKTLNEAGSMAICYSAAWQARVVTSAWWVNHNQVSKTAPTGEYLTTGSFMVRGKKNYLPPSYLVMGFGFLFKVDEDSLWRHKDERKVKSIEEELENQLSVTDSQVADSGEGDEISIPEEEEEEDEEGEEGDGSDDEEDNHQEEEEEQEDENGESKDIASGDCSDAPDNEVVAAAVDSGNNEEELKIKMEEVDDDDDDGFYPDSTIQLQHITGDKFELRRGTSTTDSAVNDDNEKLIYLGDDQPFLIKDKAESSGKQRLSAKQRRELKKQQKKQLMSDNAEEKEETANNDERVLPRKQKRQQLPASDDLNEEDEENDDRKPRKQKGQQPQEQQFKRGQKAKLKKMKDKYGDQDEEERRLKMEILASAGLNEFEGKGKKYRKKQQELLKQEQLEKRRQQQQKRAGKPKITDVLIQGVETLEAPRDDGEESDDEKEALFAEENISQESGSIIDSLTGCPDPEDILLFAVPVCSPYNTMHNYKYKVKLTPGNSKRGKAAKTALRMFQLSKETTSREKDLFKSVRDNDLSRNLPGKVKVSAPNLQKMKRK